jgi:hypothetical protein
MIMSPLAQSLIALGCVFGGSLLGVFFGSRLRDECHTSDSKEVVRLVMGLVVTTVALALGLLVGSAKVFYDTQNAEVTEIAANYILLDSVLAHYGGEAAQARGGLRTELADQVEASGRAESGRIYGNIRSGVRVGGSVLDMIQQLSPRDDSQRFLKQQALNLEMQLGQIRWLMFAQATVPFPKLLLTMLVAWLFVLFVSFGIFAPRNPLVLAGLFVSATAVCGAILLILEMYNPQAGLIRVSEVPLRAALEQLGR